jgi:uncharacterized delta-60 repeat protein
MYKLIALYFISAFSLVAQNPILDQNFASSGHFYHFSNLEFSGASALGFQSNGKIVVGGYEGMISSLTMNMNGKLFRLMPNGEVDSSFGVNGFVPDTIIPDTWGIWRLAIQPDDKIIAIGWSDYLQTGLITRFTANGKLDTSFNGNGFVTIDLYPSLIAQHSLLQVEILHNDKILVLGDVDVNLVGREVFLLKFLPNGQPDATFGLNGVAMSFASPSQELYARDLAKADDGGFFLGGTTRGGITDNPTILKVDSNGNIDQSFGINGLLRFPSVWAWDVWSLIRQGSDKLILTAEALAPNGKRNLAIMKAFTNGFIDSTFGVNGISIIDLETRGSFGVGKAILLADQSLVQSLSNLDNPYSRFALTRVLSNGKMDSTFGNNGILLSNLPATSAYFNLQALDSISFIASGLWADSNTTSFLVSKYLINSYLHLPERARNEIRVYPNPSSGFIHVSGLCQQNFYLIDQFGKKVCSGQTTVNGEQQTINLAHLPNGVYYIVSDSGFAEKISIQR